MQDSIDTLVSEDYWLGDVPGIEEWLTARTYQELAQFDKKITSKPYTTRGWRYNRIQRAGPNIAQLTSRMSRTINVCSWYPDKACIDLLNKGSTELAYDGQPFFSAAGREYNNTYTYTGNTLATLTADLSGIIKQMATFSTDTGLAIEMTPDVILCGMDTYINLKTLLNSNTFAVLENPSTANPFSEFGLRVIWSPYVPAETYYVMSTRLGMKPLFWQTTTVEGRNITLDIDDTHVASEGWYGIAASIYGAADFGFPFTCIKVSK